MEWTDERTEMLKKLWADGLSCSQIAAELGGITRDGVIGKVHRLGLSGRVKAWTDERTEMLKKLWADGLSCSQIAAELGGVTRNGVIGKVYRLGLCGRVKATCAPPRERQAPHGGNTRSRIQRAKANAAARLEPAFEPLVDVPADAKLLLELEQHHCRWPCSGAGLEAIFCGGRQVDGLSYCAGHARMAYQPARSVSERETARTAKFLTYSERAA